MGGMQWKQIRYRLEWLGVKALAWVIPRLPRRGCAMLAKAVDIAITPLTGPEAITGSTRMKAGTATKLVLNMITTAAMVRTGHVYGNLMVNVQPTNEKLRNRAIRIIAAATGVDEGQAEALLDEAGTVRVAIVMQQLGIKREQAEQRLDKAHGRLRIALGEGAV